MWVEAGEAVSTPCVDRTRGSTKFKVMAAVMAAAGLGC